MSADSGIPTFRDQGTGFWERFRAEDLATRDAFQRQPGVVWSWYEWRRMLVERAQPNPGHLAIAQLAGMRPGVRVVTQNVDDLHERSGCLDVVHLHGSLHAPRCLACARPYRAPLSDDFAAAESGQLMPPTCSHCGGKVRPGVVWFGEPLPQAAWDVAADLVCEADMVFVVGTSAQVQPAARLPGLARRAGAKLVQVNPMHTELDNACDWNLRGGAATDLPRLVAGLP
jgi:NAD-dependent deacetylase